MNINNRRILAALFLFFCIYRLAADNSLEVLLLEGTSFFKVQSVGDADKHLLWDPNETSSKWVFSINGVRLDIPDFSWILQSVRNGEYSMVASKENFTAEQFMTIHQDKKHGRLTMRFFNRSDRSIKLNIGLILDTYLGENSSIPFYFSDNRNVKTEFEMFSAQTPDWMRTTNKSNDTSLYLIFDRNQSNIPRRIVFANYFRLSQIGLDYVVNEGQSFKTVNKPREKDSAVLLDYGERNLGGGEVVEINLIFGINQSTPTSSGFIARNKDDKASPVDLPEPSKNESEQIVVNTKANDLRGRLRSVENLILEIDRLLVNKANITNDAIDQIESNTAEQERIQAQYENR